MKAVFLFGHVPVAYSGDIVPDGHAPHHQGAWPCDGFYGDMDGVWTDNSVNDTSAADARTRNVPGDGKYDQSTFPAPIKLMVGRVDLADMPGRQTWGGAATFPSELELLRNYLNKDHSFRQKQFDVPRRGLVGDYFGARDGEAFAASGWRNLASFFEAANVTTLPDQGTWISTLSSNSYLWAYGCGPGSYTSIGGLGNSDTYHDGVTTELVKNDVKAVFTLLFGSWLGDWDSEDNLQRAVLALPSYGLTCACSGRPHWFLQHMALGETIGYGARLTQNNGPTGLYRNEMNSCAGQIHIALMGDPTLRMHIVAPPSRLTSSIDDKGVNLSWLASLDSVLGYHVYRASDTDGPFTRLTTSPIATTSYTDASPSATPSSIYMVRAVKLEVSASGSYYNASQGAFLTEPRIIANTIANTVDKQAPAGSLTPTGPSPATGNLRLPISPTSRAVSTNGSRVLTPTGATVVTNSVLWVDDSLPSGAVGGADGGDAWTWVSTNPTPFSGTRASQSNARLGLHQHYFVWATNKLSVSAGEILYAYVYLDPKSVPSEIMLQWNNGSWAHRAYWGANRILSGVSGTAGRRYMGPLPAAGKWVRLEVPASQVGLEGSQLNGMAFSQFNGRATWDSAGKAAVIFTNTPPDSNGTNKIVGASVIWLDDSLPTGAVPGSEAGDSWMWVSSNPSPFSGSVANQSSISAGFHQHWFDWGSPLSVNAGEVLFAYVYIDPNTAPTEVMLHWFDGTWEHRAYWGANNIASGTDGTTSRRYMGPLPVAGQWTRLEVPASQVGLEGRMLTGMSFSQFDGRATWDYAGKALTSTTNPPPAGTTNNPPIANNQNVTTSEGTPKAILLTGSDPNGDPLSFVIVSSPANGLLTGFNANTGAAIYTPNATFNGSDSFTFQVSDGQTNSGVATVSLIVTPAATNIPPVSTNELSGVSVVDYVNLEMPGVGSNTLHVLTPSLLELKLINTKQPDPARVNQWDLVDANNQFLSPPTSACTVTADGQPVAVTAVGFKRRPLFAPFEVYDLRIENSLYLQLASPISDNQIIEVKNPGSALWASGMQFIAKADPLRYSPAIHVNQEGYVPNFAKKAMVGYYIGSMGEMTVPAASGFKIVDINSGATVYQGALVQRSDVGWTYTPTPYQKVYEADFTSFNTPGEYRLVVPGMGASLPFLIDNGIAMSFARAYALGLYHQRCGTNTAMPYTRFTHDPCHIAPASVPMPEASYPFTWTTIAGYANTINSDNPVQTAPRMTSAAAQLFPFVRQGTIDVSGGHHDAGDYSKYTENSANLAGLLMFEADSLAGVGDLDNLGIPESGDGISDVLQEAKWEADFIAKMQDTDGGFYFLVYPVNREYDGWVTPDHGDPQVIWPKTTSVTAAAVAALAQCASSPRFKAAYPATAALYLQKAKLGWQFLMNAVATYGKNGAYQKITHYSDDFADNDEMAWAACEMYLATGDPAIHQTLMQWFTPGDPATIRWGWWHMASDFGHAIRSYAFAARSGRLSASQLDPTFLAKCQSEIAIAGDDALHWSQMSAYGTSFPDATKRVQAAGWYFSADQAFDMAVAYQLNPKPEYITAMLANMNYEGGCNPVNVTFVTGLGWKRQRDIVSQWHSVQTYRLPPSGIPVGNFAANFGYLSTYGGLLESLCFPSDGASSAPYPFYDRWADSWNVTAEFTILNSSRALGTLAFLAAQTSLKTQPWKSVSAQITVPTSVAPVGSPVTLTMQAPGLDLSGARIAWDARDQDSAFGQSLTISPKNNGSQWVEAEALLPDGRRIFATNSFMANSPNIVWVDDALPAGAVAAADGGDAWNWVSSSPTPNSGSLASQSMIAAGEHQHYFSGATATLQIGAGDVLYAYVYLDPANPPSEVMLIWNDGTWNHGAYWGANSISFGSDGTASRRYMGPLPATGQWVQLTVPASQVGLEGSSLNGMAFTLFNGRATSSPLLKGRGVLLLVSGSAGRLRAIQTPMEGCTCGTRFPFKRRISALAIGKSR